MASRKHAALFLQSLKAFLNARAMRYAVSLTSIVVVVIGLIVSAQHTHLDKVVNAILQSDTRWVIATCILILAGQLLRLDRWRAIQPLDLHHAAFAIFGGQTINWISPIRVGDLWRLQTVRTNSEGWTSGAVSLLIEKFGDLVALTLLAVVASFSPLPPALSSVFFRFLFALITVCLVIALVITARKITNQNLKTPAQVRNFFTKLSAQFNRPDVWKRAMIYSIGIWVFAALNIFTLGRAFQIEFSLSMCLALIFAFQIGVTVAAVPGNLGIFPLASMSVLPFFGVDLNVAASYGILLHALAFGILILLFSLSAVYRYLSIRATQGVIRHDPA
jgi:uncharacterized membrane protein YbhN (UPF0104 family)